VPTGSASTLKTSPGDTTGGPTGHIPTNSDLPRSQHDGLNPDNKNPGKKVYGLGEETDDKDETKKVDEAKAPPFLKKKEGEEDKDEKKKIDEEDEKKAKGGGDANDRAGYTKKMHGDGEKMNEESEKDKVDEELDHEEGDKTKPSVKTEEKDDDEDDKKVVKEATVKLFAGETISEAIKTKTAAIFEETLSARIKDYRKKVNDRMTRILNERVEQIREDLSTKVNGHLDLVVENWIKTHEVALESAIKSQLVEDFILGLKGLFEEHWIEIPENKVDIVVEMATRLQTLETKLNEQIEISVQLKNQTKLYEKTEVFNKISKGLPSTQVEKLKNLSEHVDFQTTGQYEKDVNLLKESMSGKSEKTTTQRTLAEQTLDQNPNTEDTSIQQKTVLGVLARMAKK
jgi:hypothetical protein